MVLFNMGPFPTRWLAMAAVTAAVALALDTEASPASGPITDKHFFEFKRRDAPARTEPPTQPPSGTGNAACSSFLVYNTSWPAPYGGAGNTWLDYNNDNPNWGQTTYAIQFAAGGSCGSIPTTFRRGMVSHLGNTTLTFANPVSHIYIVSLHQNVGDDITVSDGQVIRVRGCLDASRDSGYFLVQLSQPTTTVVLHDHDSGGGSGVSFLLADCTSGVGSPTQASGSSAPSRGSTEPPTRRDTQPPASNAPSNTRTEPPTRPPASNAPSTSPTPDDFNPTITPDDDADANEGDESSTTGPTINTIDADSSTGNDTSSSTTMWVVILILVLFILMVAGFLLMKKRNAGALPQKPSFGKETRLFTIALAGANRAMICVSFVPARAGHCAPACQRPRAVDSCPQPGLVHALVLSCGCPRVLQKTRSTK